MGPWPGQMCFSSTNINTGSQTPVGKITFLSKMGVSYLFVLLVNPLSIDNLIANDTYIYI